MSLANSRYYRGIDRKEYLKKNTLRGHQKRFGYPATTKQRERMDYEISIIADKNLCGHFIVLAETLEYLRKFGVMEKIQGVISASFVAYCLGISDTDPLRYDIIFESYLNPISPKVPICTVEISNNRLLHLGQNQKGRLKTYLVFPSILSPEFKEGKKPGKTYSVLAPARDGIKNVFNHLAINKSPLVRFEYHSESQNLYDVCSDFYLVRETLRNIKRYRGKELELCHIPLNDPKTYELFAQRELDDIPWLGFDDLKLEIGHFGIRNFNDLIIFIGAVTSCFFPEITQGDYQIEDVYEIVYRKDNPANIPNRYPAITEILKESYGYILFYEHIVKIAVRTAGITIPEAGLLVDILLYGDIHEKAKERESFIRKARNTGYTAEESVEIFNIIGQVDRFWCKASIADWALFIYRILYLKANYRKEYDTALITGTKGESLNREEGE